MTTTELAPPQAASAERPLSASHRTPLSPAAEEPGLGDLVAGIVPLIGAVAVAGPPVIVAGAAIVLFALMLVGPFVLLVTLVVVPLVATAVLAAITGAVLAGPYLFVRQLRRHRDAHAYRPITGPVAQPVRLNSRRVAA